MEAYDHIMDTMTETLKRFLAELKADQDARYGACRCGFGRADYFALYGGTVRAVCKACGLASSDAGRHVVESAHPGLPPHVNGLVQKVLRTYPAPERATVRNRPGAQTRSPATTPDPGRPDVRDEE